MNSGVSAILLVFEPRAQAFLRQDHLSVHEAIPNHTERVSVLTFKCKLTVEGVRIEDNIGKVGVTPSGERENRDNCACGYKHPIDVFNGCSDPFYGHPVQKTDGFIHEPILFRTVQVPVEPYMRGQQRTVSVRVMCLRCCPSFFSES